MRCCRVQGPGQLLRRKTHQGIATLGAAFFQKPVIVRMSDFKSIINQPDSGRYDPGGKRGRGLLHFCRLSDSFRECFELECRALKKVRNEMGLTNVEIMVPFAHRPEAGR